MFFSSFFLGSRSSTVDFVLGFRNLQDTFTSRTFLLFIEADTEGSWAVFFSIFFTADISSDIGVKFYSILCMVINFHFIRVKGRNYLYRLYRVFRKEVKKVILRI